MKHWKKKQIQWVFKNDGQTFYIVTYEILKRTLIELGCIRMQRTHPVLDSILRKFGSCVRGTNFTHVAEEMSNIPVSMVILSISSVETNYINVSFNNKDLDLTFTYIICHAVSYRDLTHHIVGRWCMVHTQNRQQLWASGKNLLNMWLVHRGILTLGCHPLLKENLWSLAEGDNHTFHAKGAIPCKNMSVTVPHIRWFTLRILSMAFMSSEFT